jgi:hypothetical protein
MYIHECYDANDYTHTQLLLHTQDRSFTFVLKTSPASVLVKKAAGGLPSLVICVCLIAILALQP